MLLDGGLIRRAGARALGGGGGMACLEAAVGEMHGVLEAASPPVLAHRLDRSR